MSGLAQRQRPRDPVTRRQLDELAPGDLARAHVAGEHLSGQQELGGERVDDFLSFRP